MDETPLRYLVIWCAGSPNSATEILNFMDRCQNFVVECEDLCARALLMHL